MILLRAQADELQKRTTYQVTSAIASTRSHATPSPTQTHTYSTQSSHSPRCRCPQTRCASGRGQAQADVWGPVRTGVGARWCAPGCGAGVNCVGWGAARPVASASGPMSRRRSRARASSTCTGKRNVWTKCGMKRGSISSGTPCRPHRWCGACAPRPYMYAHAPHVPHTSAHLCCSPNSSEP